MQYGHMARLFRIVCLVRPPRIASAAARPAPGNSPLVFCERRRLARLLAQQHFVVDQIERRLPVGFEMRICREVFFDTDPVPLRMAPTQFVQDRCQGSESTLGGWRGHLRRLFLAANGVVHLGQRKVCAAEAVSGRRTFNLHPGQITIVLFTADLR